MTFKLIEYHGQRAAVVDWQSDYCRDECTADSGSGFSGDVDKYELVSDDWRWHDDPDVEDTESYFHGIPDWMFQDSISPITPWYWPNDSDLLELYSTLLQDKWGEWTNVRNILIFASSGMQERREMLIKLELS